jgi:hypothetical protein
MIKIGVLSDTHFSGLQESLPFLEWLTTQYFFDCEIILHAGDMVDPEILFAFGPRKVYAVQGNMDSAATGVPLRRIIEVGGFRIGLVHGWGPPAGLEDRILKEFHGERIDGAVYGHSHLPLCVRREGILLFNPGSPTDRRRAPFHSVGILTVGASLEGRILHIDR